MSTTNSQATQHTPAASQAAQRNDHMHAAEVRGIVGSCVRQLVLPAILNDAAVMRRSKPFLASWIWACQHRRLDVSLGQRVRGLQEVKQRQRQGGNPRCTKTAGVPLPCISPHSQRNAVLMAAARQHRLTWQRPEKTVDTMKYNP
eukprot:TRINITY_DN7987_c0_g2_i3.p1 TRINITY_DN7987_c0_g2~~TRINITY_DN7987_c0_g2_i3.p1  ORF type:complete len:163 (+),score=11.11 TRINITY_DN7987_c0_g2_i3:57-491(+)